MALPLVLQGVEIIRIAEKPLNVNLLIGVVYVLRGGYRTAQLGHPVHPPFIMFGPDAGDHVGLLVRAPGPHFQRHS